MAHMVEWIYATARPAAVWALFAVTLIFAIFLFPVKAAHYPRGFKTFDGSFYYTPTIAREKLEQLGPTGRAVYRSQELQLDLVFPIVYTFFLAWGLALVTPGTPLPRWIVIVPFIGALADYIENKCALEMLFRYEHQEPIDTLARIGGVATPIKQVLLYASFIVLVLLAIARVFRR